jgi:hypothetical protein
MGPAGTVGAAVVIFAGGMMATTAIEGMLAKRPRSWVGLFGALSMLAGGVIVLLS